MWWRDSDGRINGGILGTVPGPRILHQQAPASVSKRCVLRSAAFYFIIPQEAAGCPIPLPSPLPRCFSITISRSGREMFALVMNDSSRTERSLSSVRAFVSKLGSGKRNVSRPARQETSGGAESTIISLLHKCLHVFYTRCLSCWLLSLSVQFYKIPQLWHYFQIPIKFGSATLAHDSTSRKPP